MLPNKQTKLNLAILLIAAALCMAAVSYAAPMGTAFTYQGRLADANSPAEGLYDFEFELHDDAVADSQQGSTIDVDDVNVVDGYFTVQLDFGNGPNIFNGDARWLQVAVRPGASTNVNDFVTLSPRQELTPTPYAIHTRGIFVNDSGNVGIGTTKPLSKLSVGGDGIPDTGVYGSGDTGVRGRGSITGLSGVGGPTGVYGFGTSYGMYGVGNIAGVHGQDRGAESGDFRGGARFLGKGRGVIRGGL